MDNRGAFNYDILQLFEEVYKNNSQKEDNWEFYYYLVKDRNEKIIVATFLHWPCAKRICLPHLLFPPR